MASKSPAFKVPRGDVTVRVSLINPVNFGPAILKRFMAPDVPLLERFKDSPSLTFLIEHPSGRKLVWDLGIRKDYQNYSKSISDYLPTTNYNIQVDKNVVDILEENGIPGDDIEAVIWRYVVALRLDEKSDFVDSKFKPLALGSYWRPIQLPAEDRSDCWARLF